MQAIQFFIIQGNLVFIIVAWGLNGLARVT